MDRKVLFERLDRVAKIAAASKWRRFLSSPLKYASAILFRELFYRGKPLEVTAITFFGREIQVLLPSSSDIYITGGKSHDSEIRLARFLIRHLKSGDIFVDVGAHYGYFSLLASELVGDQGAVYAFEASQETFAVLRQNTLSTHNARAIHIAISDEEATLTFYEFPNRYSEYNALDISQYEDEPWFQSEAPKRVEVPSVPLDSFFTKHQLHPDLIKVDVEGAEYKAVRGMASYLASKSPVLAMEYVSDARGNDEHRKAERFLKELGYNTHIIDGRGELTTIGDVPSYLDDQRLESDNIVFAKSRGGQIL